MAYKGSDQFSVAYKGFSRNIKLDMDIIKLDMDIIR